MTTNKLIYSFLLLSAFVLALYSCKEDKNVYLEGNTLYSANGIYKVGSNENKLIFTYNANTLTNKDVEFYSKDFKTAKLTFENVIEGESKTIIDSVVLVTDNNKYIFEGDYISATSDTFRYSGYIIASAYVDKTLSLNLQSRK